MSVRIITDNSQDFAVLYCSTSMWAFGPVFHSDGHIDAETAALCFLNWWDGQGFDDPRTVNDADLGAREKSWLDAIAGGQWTGSMDTECALCHGDGDYTQADGDEQVAQEAEALS